MDRFNRGRQAPGPRFAARLLSLMCLAALIHGPAAATEDNAPSVKPPAAESDLPPLTARQLGEPMSIARLDALIRRAGEDVQRQGTRWVFKVAERQIQVVSDPRADRMRILVPVRDVSGLDARELYRLLQAGFETALDARYAIAGEMVWSVFIHPLRTLDDAEFLSGLGQTINLAKTYGTEYTSGLLSYGGGDAAARKRRQLIDELLKSGDAI